MAETVAQELHRCYHCGLESVDTSFKYFDNKKPDQPRYKCHHCHKFFTLGWHGRPQGKTYSKKRNEDPDELKNLSRQCCHCGVSNNAVFKYYNNKHISQPRFKCLSCGKQFQMRLLGTGEERHLVHTSSAGRAPRRQKQGMPESFPNAPNFTSGTGNSEPSPSSDDDVMTMFGDLLEAELLADDDAQPVFNGNENAKLMNFTGAGVRDSEAPNTVMVSNNMAKMVSESTSNNIEVRNETLPLKNPAASGSEPQTWTQNDTFFDPYDVNYVDEVATFCNQMDFEMPTENSMEQIDTFVNPYDINYADDAAVCNRQMDLEIAMRNHTPWNH